MFGTIYHPRHINSKLKGLERVNLKQEKGTVGKRDGRRKLQNCPAFVWEHMAMRANQKRERLRSADYHHANRHTQNMYKIRH